VGHSAAVIRIRPIGGPLVAVGANALRVRFDALAPATSSAGTGFLAFTEGDDAWRYAEQIGIIRRVGLNEGKDQEITFPPLADVQSAATAIDLRATSDSGLPVEYYVAHGPATIENGKLLIHDIPRRARLPLEVKVVAYQFGRALEPLVKTAEPVTRVLRVH
jgi:hypothetical protein